MTTVPPLSKIGFTCAYTPLPLIRAAGFAPYRVLPLGDAPDQAGQWLHDNLCPHVKRILDRAIVDDLPALAGMVIVNSCDTMRRLADAWQRIRPDDRLFLMDLPTTAEERAVAYFTTEMERLAAALSDWGAAAFGDDDLLAGIRTYNEIASLFEQARNRLATRQIPMAGVRLQELYNQAATLPWNETLTNLQAFVDELAATPPSHDKVPIFLFGNVLPDPQAFQLLEESGAHIVSDDLCTGSRLFHPIDTQAAASPYHAIAAAMFTKPPCARTFDPQRPARLAENLLDRAQHYRAQGVIGYTLKFCDPYLARLPMIQQKLQQARMPLLLLEGDLSPGTMGQQRTRIEAFIEMLR